MPKQLFGSVGAGGRNAMNDVATVQYLLNCVPSGRGGPKAELAMDGLCGPLTSAAIRAFQRTQNCPQDGRIDPGGPTYRALAGYDPYPRASLPPISGGGAKSGQNWTGKSAGGGGFNPAVKFGPGGKSGYDPQVKFGGYDPHIKFAGYDPSGKGGGYPSGTQTGFPGSGKSDGYDPFGKGG
jgi:hypothetical protein